MKILYVLGSFYPAQNGGPNNSIYWAASELVRRDVDVTVVSLRDGLTPNHLSDFNLFIGRECIINGIRAWYFGYYPNRYFSFGMFRWLIANIKNYDIVNLSSVFFPWTWFAALLCTINRVPFSLAPRGELEPGAYFFSKKRKDFVSFLFLRRLMARSSFVLVTSEQEKELSKFFFPRDMVFKILPNFVDLSSFGATTFNVREKKDILYLGRLHPKKGIENLIDAFDRLDSSVLDDNRLLVVGSGDIGYVNKLKARAGATGNSGAIHFLGHKVGEEKARIFRKAKVMVLPSYSENFGNVVVEALAESTPVIASRFTPWSCLEEEGCGRWVGNDPESLALALKSILVLNQQDYTAMSESARRLVTEVYDIREKGEELKSLYASAYDE
jgi:glycosyltransferase involved in cell wall biosynthesis